MQGNKGKLKRPSLASLRYKSKFEIFELGFITVQIKIRNFRAWPYCGAIIFLKFQAWPYFGAYEILKMSGLALLRYKSIFQILELGLIGVQTDFQNFRAWPYCGVT